MPKILIVDDEARILLLLQSLLKANGYDVVTAKDGNSALDAVKSDTFDLSSLIWCRRWTASELGRSSLTDPP